MIRFRFRQHPIPRGVLPIFFGLNDTGFLTQNSLVIPFRTTYEETPEDFPSAFFGMTLLIGMTIHERRHNIRSHAG